MTPEPSTLKALSAELGQELHVRPGERSGVVPRSQLRAPSEMRHELVLLRARVEQLQRSIPEDRAPTAREWEEAAEVLFSVRKSADELARRARTNARWAHTELR